MNSLAVFTFKHGLSLHLIVACPVLSLYWGIASDFMTRNATDILKCPPASRAAGAHFAEASPGRPVSVSSKMYCIITTFCIFGISPITHPKWTRYGPVCLPTTTGCAAPYRNIIEELVHVFHQPDIPQWQSVWPRNMRLAVRIDVVPIFFKPGRHILRNYTCIFGVCGVCRVYTKNTQNTPCISGVFLEVAFQERVKLVYFTSDVYLV